MSPKSKMEKGAVRACTEFNTRPEKLSELSRCGLRLQCIARFERVRGLVLPDFIVQQRVVAVPAGIRVMNAEDAGIDLLRARVIVHLAEELLAVIRRWEGIEEFARRIGFAPNIQTRGIAPLTVFYGRRPIPS
jgi:hypothetical protein